MNRKMLEEWEKSKKSTNVGGKMFYTEKEGKK